MADDSATRDDDAPPTGPEGPIDALGFARDLLHLASVGGGEVTRLAAELHHAIASGPFAWLPGYTPRAERAPFPYAVVAASFDGLARLARRDPPTATPGALPWPRVIGALNGVAGDRLSELSSGLATPLGLRDAQGRATSWPDRTDALWLYVHGLCGTDLDWHAPAHDAFVEGRASSGEDTRWLRYNSGRSIHENGAELARLLEAAPEVPLHVVGHSMGGLVLRSAFEQGARSASAWLERVVFAAYLGTPHLGAPLERAGHVLGSLLPLTPWTQPFERLAEIRARGIRELRYGAITPEAAREVHEHNRAPEQHPALPARAHHLLLAASAAEPLPGHPLGDGLVPVSSAHGLADTPERSLTAPRLTRERVDGLGHMGLLGDARVYDLLQRHA
jgi:hypothetical protein